MLLNVFFFTNYNIVTLLTCVLLLDYKESRWHYYCTSSKYDVFVWFFVWCPCIAIDVVRNYEVYSITVGFSSVLYC